MFPKQLMIMHFNRQCEMLHYTPKTNLYHEITDIEHRGDKKIEEFVNQLIEQYKDDQIKGTELTMFLNWKCWDWFEINKERSKLYENLWRKIDSYISNHWQGEKLQYFLRETD